MTSRDLDDRMAAPEREQAHLRARLDVAETDSTAARTLAAGADHDVTEVRAELRAHTRSLNALRETQVEQGQKIDHLAGKVGSLEGKVDEGSAKMSIGMAEIAALLRRLEAGGDPE